MVKQEFRKLQKPATLSVTNIMGDQLIYLPLADITVEKQIRQDMGDLEPLKKSIAEYGVIEPVIVTKQDDKYVLIAGERRLRACQELERENIPALIKHDVSKQEHNEIQMVENFQRVDLSLYEKALGLVGILNNAVGSLDDIAAAVESIRSNNFSGGQHSPTLEKLGINPRIAYGILVSLTLPIDHEKYLYQHNIPYSVLELFAGIADGIFVAKCLDDYVLGAETRASIAKKIASYKAVKKDQPPKAKKRVSVDRYFRKQITTVNELVEEDVILRDKEKLSKTIDELVESINKLKEKYGI